MGCAWYGIYGMFVVFIWYLCVWFECVSSLSVRYLHHWSQTLTYDGLCVCVCACTHVCNVGLQEVTLDLRSELTYALSGCSKWLCEVTPALSHR